MKLVNCQNDNSQTLFYMNGAHVGESLDYGITVTGAALSHSAHLLIRYTVELGVARRVVGRLFY